MPALCVIDTMVLRKANAALCKEPMEHRAFAKRVALLKRIRENDLRVLISPRLLREYREQVLEPRNDFVTSFFAIVADPTRHRLNWPRWSGANAEKQAKCRFPQEDSHVLRNAVVDGDSSTIFTEETRMLTTDSCIHRNFRVHVADPTAQ